MPPFSARPSCAGSNRRCCVRAATWKIIASDMPISIVVPDLNPDVPQGTFEAWANGDNGKPRGRELEVASLLKFIKQHDIKNVVWVTADVHYASATYYSPEKPSSPTSSRSGNSSAAPCMPALSVRRDRPHLRPRKATSASPGHEAEPSAQRRAQFFGMGHRRRHEALTVSLRHRRQGSVQVELPPEA